MQEAWVEILADSSAEIGFLEEVWNVEDSQTSWAT